MDVLGNTAVQEERMASSLLCVSGSCEENLADTVLMLWNSRLLNGINWAFFLSVIGLNIFGLMVTNHLGSVFRAVLLTSRTALVRLSLAPFVILQTDVLICFQSS